MLHKLFNIVRPLIVLDVESTGTDVRQDRIIELGFQVWRPQTEEDAGGLAKEWRSLIRPGIPIPASSTAIHNITDSMVNACRSCGRSYEAHVPLGPLMEPTLECQGFRPWPKFSDLATNLALGFKDCDYAGKRVRFDLQITAVEMQRAKIEWSYAGARIVDIDRLEQIAIPRTLAALHEKYTGHLHDGAHGALSDVRAATTVIALQLEAHKILSRDLNELHQLQWPGWIDGEGKFRFVDGVACFSRWGKHAGKPMNHPNVNRPDWKGQTYWDFILKDPGFSAEVKALARNAKLGKFPYVKCDGNHGGPRCADPECWNQ